MVGERGAEGAAVLRTHGVRRQLVLCDPQAQWACVVCEVPSGVHLSDAGDAFFADWRSAMFPRRFEILSAGRPTIW